MSQKPNDKSTALAVINRDGGSAAEVNTERLKAIFAAQGTNLNVVDCSGPTLQETLSNQWDSSMKFLLVCGGDGTVETAARFAVAEGCTLALLPGGTFNRFIQYLGFPLNYIEAAEQLAAGTIGSIDVASVNDRIWLDVVSIGAHPYAITARKLLRKRLPLPKWLGSSLGLLWSLVRTPKLRLQLNIDGKAKTVTRHFVLIANGDYAADTAIKVPTRNFCTGHLTLIYPETSSRWNFIKMATSAALLATGKPDGLVMKKVTQVQITARRRRIKAAIGGEIERLSTPLNLKIERQALKLLLPTDHQALENCRAS